MNKPQRREGFVAADDDGDEPRLLDQAVPQQDGTPPELERPREQWPIKVRLIYKAVRDDQGEMLHELSFREPTGGDINRYGNPIRVNQEGDVVIDDRKMMTMIAVLSGVLQPFLERMDPRDYCSCAYRLRGFFLPDLSAW